MPLQKNKERSFKMCFETGLGSPPRCWAPSTGRLRNCRERTGRVPGPGTAPRVSLLGRVGTPRAPRGSACSPPCAHRLPHFSFLSSPLCGGGPRALLSLPSGANCRTSPVPQWHTCEPQWRHLCRRPPCSRRLLSPGTCLFRVQITEPHLRALGPL